MSELNEEAKREVQRKAVDALFEDYRKSGLTLMTTVIGLSAGGFVGLFQVPETREASFLYLIPIAVALMQQLTYYLARKSLANSELHDLWSKAEFFDPKEDWFDMIVEATESRMYSNYYYGLSDAFATVAVVLLGVVTIWPLAIFSSSLVGGITCIVLSACLGYWAYRRYRINREIAKVEY